MQGFELAFNRVTPDRLAVAFAAALRAQVIGIASGAARRPAGRQRRSAVPAYNGAPKREVLAEVLAHPRSRIAVHALLNLLEGLEADKAFTLTFAKAKVPGWRFDIARNTRTVTTPRFRRASHEPS